MAGTQERIRTLSSPMRSTRLIGLSSTTLTLFAASLASAAPPAAGRRAALHEHAPVADQVELGLYGGVMAPATDHSFFGTQWRPLRPAVGSLGGRLGYYPLRWGGIEAEAGGFPGRTRDGDYFNAFAVRGHALLQLPYRVAPFVLGGVGALMVRTPNEVLGTDVDPAWHLGAGLKFGALRWLRLRLEWRATFSNDRAADAGRPAIHHEVLLGLSFAFGPRSRPHDDATARTRDADGDGLPDARDRCPQLPGAPPDGCPRGDRDFDGFANDVDRCPDESGVVPDGCPFVDRDGDRYADPLDRCPDAPGGAPDGCPLVDTDKDRIADLDDRCPEQAEEHNGFDDGDGCPDVLPWTLKRYTGSIKGIDFASGEATVDPRSDVVLDEIVQLLTTYPSVRLAIVGHTDDRGSETFNYQLSLRRAEAVRDYLVAHGIAPGRLTVRGAGGSEPLASNRTPAGRSENRRIEFLLMSE